VAQKFDNFYELNFIIFLKLFLYDCYSFEDYEKSLNSRCTDISKSAETIDSIESAQFLFSQVLLIYCFKKHETVFETKMNNLVKKIHLIFEKYNHPRKILTSKFFETEPQQILEKLPSTNVNLDDFSTKDVTLDSFLEDKKIVHFIEMGSKSNP
jgi:hypothetical protein